MKVSLIQLCSTRDIAQNLARCNELANQAIADGADWILFPENAPFLGADREKFAIAESVDGPIVAHFRDIARRGNCWVSLGSFAEKIQANSDNNNNDADGANERTYNTQLLLNRRGETVAVYRKIHLFDVDVEGGQTFLESGSVAPGEDVVSAEITLDAQSGAQKVGLTICYDLRFPELYRALSAQNATILTVPSAFTLATGRDHWHPLLQARAIENQAYVLAPNQWGHHFGERRSYGHSAIYDPWGRRIACAPDTECVVSATLDFEYLNDVRQQMPCLGHRRLGRQTASTPE